MWSGTWSDSGYATGCVVVFYYLRTICIDTHTSTGHVSFDLKFILYNPIILVMLPAVPGTPGGKH